MIKVTDRLCTIKPEATFTIYDVEQFTNLMQEKLAVIREIALDFGSVEEFDTAGFQTIYALYKSAVDLDIAIYFINTSPAVDRIIKLFGVSDWYQSLLKVGGANAT